MNFNNLTGDTLHFEDDKERTFKVEVRKEKDRTIIDGDGGKKYISKNKVIEGEYIAFSLKGAVNRLKTLYFSSQDDEVDEDDEDDQDR